MPPTNEEEIKKLIWSCYQRRLKYSYSSSLFKRRALLDEATEEVKHFHQKAKQLAEELKTPPTAPTVEAPDAEIRLEVGQVWVHPNGKEHRTIKNLETYAPDQVFVWYETTIPGDMEYILKWNLKEPHFKTFIKEHRLTLLPNKAN